MNRNSISLREFGFYTGLLDELLSQHVHPLFRTLWGAAVPVLDHHKSFIVNYSLGEDVDLSYHFDDAEFTMNLCLSKSFNGGHLRFGFSDEDGPHSRKIVRQKMGYAVFHKGSHMHEALPITYGERLNLIMVTSLNRIAPI